MSAPQVVAWILYIVLAQFLGALWFEWARREPRAEDRPGWYALWIGATVASLVAILQGTIDLRLLSTDFWASLRRATGTMLDANSYGLLRGTGSASVVARGALAAADDARRSGRRLRAQWAGMWMSGSRTALMCSIVGTTGLSSASGDAQSRRPARTGLRRGRDHARHA